MRSLLCQCTNVLCGYTFVASLEAIRTISPSANPDAAIDLPQSNLAKARQAQGKRVTYEKPIKKGHLYVQTASCSAPETA